MLSRTASHLFWMGRHLERMETAARLLDVGQRITLLPNTEAGYRNEWESLLKASGTSQVFYQNYDEPSQENLEEFFYFDRNNPASVVSCMEKAREGGRIVRTALTNQVWDVLNTSYQELRKIERKQRSKVDMSQLTEFATRVGASVRGAHNGTQLRNDGWHFFNLGARLERADATARLVDVKYFVLLPRIEFVGSELDTYQWQVLLRALSLHRSFHWAYGGDITAGRVTDFLILNGENPRALVTSITEAVWHLTNLSERYGDNVSSNAKGLAENLLADLQSRKIDEIFEDGLHEFLTNFIKQVGGVSNAIHEDYLRGAG